MTHNTETLITCKQTTKVPKRFVAEASRPFYIAYSVRWAVIGCRSPASGARRRRTKSLRSNTAQINTFYKSQIHLWGNVTGFIWGVNWQWVSIGILYETYFICNL